MKKIIIIISSVVLTIFIFALTKRTYSNSELQDTRFPDKNFYKCIVDTIGNDAINSDGTIKDEKLLSITTLKCDNKEINSVKGIELLINIENIDLTNNKISDVNVKNNKKLKSLNLSNNEIATNKSLCYTPENAPENAVVCANTKINIDLSNNTELVYLNLSKNKIMHIGADIDKNEKLEELYLNNNQIIALSISDNINLKKLDVSNNQIEYLDLSNNPNLTYLNIHTNNISELDVSKNTKLEELYVYKNKLTKIDVSKNVNLKKFKGNKNNIRNVELISINNLEETDMYEYIKLNTELENYGKGKNKKVYNRNDELISSGKLGTGYKVKIDKVEFYIVVPGDITGDGKLELPDVAKAYQYLKNKITMENTDIEAANVSTSNQSITVNDIAKMYQYLKGKISSLE